jgi:hypothetical protein
MPRLNQIIAVQAGKKSQAKGLCNALSFRPQVRPLWPGHTPSQP